MNTVDQNKQVVVSYYEMAFGGNPEKAVELYLGNEYIQHNPQAANGPEAFIAFVHALRSANPDMHLDIKRVVAEGDLVVTHAHLVLKAGEPGLALADIFRLVDGKVVEHWDVIQPVPDTAKNENGMF